MTHDSIASHEPGGDVECRFDETTGILHVVFDGPIGEGKPAEGYLLELIAHHRGRRPLNGIVIFNRQAVRYKEINAALRHRY